MASSSSQTSGHCFFTDSATIPSPYITYPAANHPYNYSLGYSSCKLPSANSPLHPADYFPTKPPSAAIPSPAWPATNLSPRCYRPTHSPYYCRLLLPALLSTNPSLIFFRRSPTELPCQPANPLYTAATTILPLLTGYSLQQD
ncbi:hypothetical protein AAC387_Pa01g2467 [Persea americana]